MRGREGRRPCWDGTPGATQEPNSWNQLFAISSRFAVRGRISGRCFEEQEEQVGLVH